jgi:hypothetical protein
MEKVETPGVIGKRPESAPPPHLQDIALAARSFVKDSVRTLAAEEQRARVWGEQARALIEKADKRPYTLNPKERERRRIEHEDQMKDVGAFIEGTGNIEKQGDDIGSVKARMTRPMEELAMKWRHGIEYQRQRLNYHLKGLSEAEYLAYLPDYLSHFYVQNEQFGASLNKFLKDSPSAKKRVIPTLAEATRYGFRPITQNPAVLYEVYSRINWQVAVNRRLMGEISRLRTPDGQPVVQPTGTAPDGWVPLEHRSLFQKVTGRQLPGLEESKTKTLLWKSDMSVHPDVYAAIKQIMDRPISAPGRVYDTINSFARATAFMLSGFHDVSLGFASLGAHLANFSLSSPNPVRGLWRFFERDPVTGERKWQQSAPAAGQSLLHHEEAVADAALHGLRFAWTDSAAFEYTSRHAVDQTLQWAEKLLPSYKPLIRAVRQWGKLRQENLWSKTHDALKILAYHDIVLKELERAPGTIDTSAIKERTASFLNDAFGGQDWQTMFWSDPYMRRIWGRAMLAPDWTLSTIRSIPFVSDLATLLREKTPRVTWEGGLPRRVQGPLPGVYEGLPANMMRLKFWLLEASAVLMATQAVQWAITMRFGDPAKGDHLYMWENEPALNRLGDTRYNVDVTPIMRLMPWHDPTDNSRRYMNMGKRAAEVLRWFLDPLSNIEAKLSRPVAEGIKQVTGKEGAFEADWAREETSTTGTLLPRALSIAKNALPFTVTGNQFLMTQPMKKGMTRYKAQKAFEALYEITADPSAIGRFVRSWSAGRPRVTPVTPGDILSMMQQVGDAAQRNGVNPEGPRGDAYDKVKGYHTAAFRKAFVRYSNALEEKNQSAATAAKKDMDEEMRYIERLGYKASGLLQSIKGEYRQRTTPSPADVTAPPP